MSESPARVLIVRLWTDDPLGAFRARVMEAPDAAGDPERVTLAASVDELVAAVRDWATRMSEAPG